MSGATAPLMYSWPLRIPGVEGAGADLAEIGAVIGLQGRDIEHHVALRRRAGERLPWAPHRRGAEIARIGHHREFVVVELRGERAVIGGLVAMLEAERMAQLVGDGEKRVGSEILCLYVAVARAEDRIPGSVAAQVGEERRRRVLIAGLGDANGGGIGGGRRCRDEFQAGVGGDEVEGGELGGLLAVRQGSESDERLRCRVGGRRTIVRHLRRKGIGDRGGGGRPVERCRPAVVDQQGARIGVEARGVEGAAEQASLLHTVDIRCFLVVGHRSNTPWLKRCRPDVPALIPADR